MSGSLAGTGSASHRTVGAVESDYCAPYPKMLHDATFLNAVLPFAVGQAQRHREPLSLVCIAIDRLHGIQDLLGRAVADSLVRSVGETVMSLIRSSDIVVRLDDDRVVAVLPRSGDSSRSSHRRDDLSESRRKALVACRSTPHDDHGFRRGRHVSLFGR